MYSAMSSIPSGGPPGGTHTQELWYSLRGIDAWLQSVLSADTCPCDACCVRVSRYYFCTRILSKSKSLIFRRSWKFFGEKTHVAFFFLKKQHTRASFFFRKKQPHHHHHHHLSSKVSLSPSLCSVSFRESACFARVNTHTHRERERETFIFAFYSCSSSFAALCWKKKSRYDWLLKKLHFHHHHRHHFRTRYIYKSDGGRRRS